MLLEILKAILFGIVEGITEWLPISSTGHMILLDQVVKLNVSADFYKMPGKMAHLQCGLRLSLHVFLQRL